MRSKSGALKLGLAVVGVVMGLGLAYCTQTGNPTVVRNEGAPATQVAAVTPAPQTVQPAQPVVRRPAAPATLATPATVATPTTPAAPATVAGARDGSAGGGAGRDGRIWRAWRGRGFEFAGAEPDVPVYGHE